MRTYTREEIEMLLIENARLRHACRQACRALTAFDHLAPRSTAATLPVAAKPIDRVPVNIFKKGQIVR